MDEMCSTRPSLFVASHVLVCLQLIYLIMRNSDNTSGTRYRYSFPQNLPSILVNKLANKLNASDCGKLVNKLANKLALLQIHM